MWLPLTGGGNSAVITWLLFMLDHTHLNPGIGTVFRTTYSGRCDGENHPYGQ